MPNIKSAIKRTKVTAKKTAANRSKKSEIRTAVKKTRAAVASSPEGAADLYRSTQATLIKPQPKVTCIRTLQPEKNPV